MVLRCSEIDGPPKPPPAPPRAAAGFSFSVPFENPTLRWGSTRILRCQLVSGHRDTADRRQSSASPSPPPPPPPPPPQTKNDRSPPSSRPRLVIRIPCRTQPKEPERDGPPAPQERRDRRREARTAGGGRTPVEIGRPVSGPVTRSLRFRAGAEGDKKTAKNVRPAEFSLSLSKEEMMEDFIAMTGAKLPRRPKQRPRPVQKNLNGIFPGSDLPKVVTPGLYRVSDSSQ
ncbi:WAS/WASL-interacting protein family member 3-like [Phoenix dactylifera]|uniref:WAS/WASL-interacting protein family member 3-like n=1 Tax=Phoenix dactylifera TaxID=42345 RepID=A0A8B7CF93_PHODC|nr:WAS/WASL-interacting protein family member 3-like [Phoenix dactylifera]